MNITRHILLVFLIVLTTLSAVGQVENYGKKDDVPKKAETLEFNSADDGKKWDWSKARIGGNFGLAFERGGISIDASPTFGYRINKVVEAGAGFKLFYYKDDAVPLVDQNGIIRGYVPYNSITYGPLAYGRFFIWEGIFAMAQYEMANKKPYYLDNPNDRINVHHLLLGGGYSTSIGSAGQLNLSLLYNVLDNKESIYQFGTFGDFPLMLNISVGFGINRRR